MTTELHEASHAAACVLLSRKIEYVAIHDNLHALPGEELGRVRAPVPRDEGVRARDVIVALIGYVAEGEKDWPPSFEDAKSERRESLDILIRLLKLSEQRYAELVEVTRELEANPDFRRLRDSIARALRRVPRLLPEDLDALCAVHGIPTQQEQEHANAA